MDGSPVCIESKTLDILAMLSVESTRAIYACVMPMRPNMMYNKKKGVQMQMRCK